MFERTRRPARPTRRTTARPGDHDEPTTTPSTSSGPLPASVFEGGREEQRSRGRGRTSEADSASLSPWTGVGSPSSSDFEAISDSEVRQVDFSSSSAAPPSTRMREDSPSSSFTTSSSSFSRGRRSSSAREGDDSDANRRGIEGDDEDSSAFEDAGGYGGGYGEDERGRGRGRTRRREPGPEMRRSMLEDALRSSLATLLSLAPVQPSAMSQTPSMSHASLAALWSPTASTSSAPPAAAPRPSMQRVSPFASALEDDEEEEEDLEHLDRPTLSSGEDVFLSSSSSSSSSSDEDGTQLDPSSSTRSHAAPLPINITSASSSRSRTRSYSHPESAFAGPSSTSSATSTFSPLHPSRPLGAPSSNSPPTFSRSRRGGGERWSGGIRKRGRGGRGGSTSPAPAPASVEERRRARAEAAAAWGSASVVPTSLGGGRGGVRGYEERERRGTGTDVEEGTVERDEAFAELLSAARFFSDLSPRSSRTSLPSLYTSSTASASSATQPLFSSTRSALDDVDGQDDGGDEEMEEEDDSALASESVPTLEGLSSGDSRGSGGRSRSPSSVEAEKSAGGAAAEKEKKVEEKEKEGEKGKEKKRGGILGWLRGLGSAVVELKVWHLVGICGLLIGVGLGAGSLISSLASSTPLLSFLHLTPPSPLTPASGSLIKVPPRIARFGSSAPRGEEGGMSALFC